MLENECEKCSDLNKDRPVDDWDLCSGCYDEILICWSNYDKEREGS